MDGLSWKTLLKWMIWGYHYNSETPIWIIYDHILFVYKMFMYLNISGAFGLGYHQKINTLI